MSQITDKYGTSSPAPEVSIVVEWSFFAERKGKLGLPVKEQQT